MTTVFCLFHTLKFKDYKNQNVEVDELEAIYLNSNEAHEEAKKRGGLRHVEFWKVK